jgi:hypothetical protein
MLAGARRAMRPSPALVLASVAVLIVLGGTAVAATATTTKEHGTAVSAADVPKQPFFGKAFVSTGGQNVLIAANTATVALTRVNVDNYYGQTGRRDDPAVAVRVGRKRDHLRWKLRHAAYRHLRRACRRRVCRQHRITDRAQTTR